MAVQLAPNQYPAGIRPGSPIDKVGDPYHDANSNTQAASIPVPAEARAGDVMVLWLNLTGAGSVGPTGGPWPIPSASWTPIDFGFAGPIVGVGTNYAHLYGWYHVVAEGEAGQNLSVAWNIGGSPGAAMVAWCLRYVNPATPVNAVGPGWASGGDVRDLNSGDCAPSDPDCLIVAAFAQCGITGTAAADPGVPSTTYDNFTGGNPRMAVVSGVIDMPFTYDWPGAGWTPLYGGTAGTAAGAGWAAAFNPIRPPSAPTPSIPGLNPDLAPADYSNWTHDTNTTITSLAWGWLEFKATAGGNISVQSGPQGTPVSTTAPGMVPVAANTRYAASLQFQAPAGGTGRTCNTVLRWYDSGGAFISSVTGPNVTDVPAGTPVPGTVVATSPVNAAYAQLEALVTGCAAGEQHLITPVHRLRQLNSFDVSKGFSASWTPNPSPGDGPQSAWLVGRQVDGTLAQVGFWNPDANLWNASEFWGLGDDTSYVWPDGSWGPNDGTVWQVYFATKEGARGLKSDLAGPLFFSADPAPVVTSVTITSPNSATPTIGWTESITRAASAQTQYRAKLFTVAATLAAGFNPATSTAVYDSGAVSSAALSQITTALAGGQDLVPYVQITQTAGQSSTWVAGASFFNGQGAALAVPALTASPATNPLTAAPRVALALSGTAATAKVEYSDDGGATWATVRDDATGVLATAVALAGSPTVYDGEATPGATRSYRATGYSAAGAYPRSATSPTVTAVPPLGQFWLRRPLTGDSMLIKVTGDRLVEKLREDATEYRIGGRKNTVWIREAPVHGVTLKFSLYFTDQGSSDRFDAMRNAQETLLLQTDYGKQWYVALPPEPERPLRLTGSRLAGKPIRDLELEVAEQDRP